MVMIKVVCRAHSITVGYVSLDDEGDEEQQLASMGDMRSVSSILHDACTSHALDFPWR